MSFLSNLLGRELKDPLGLYKDTEGLGQDVVPDAKIANDSIGEANKGDLARRSLAESTPIDDAPLVLSDPDLPAGMRNSNPGNIKYREDVPWNGLTGPSVNTDQGDPQAVFKSHELGMRAAAKLARNKYNKGLKTPLDIIAADGGWTPGNTQAAANIAKTMGIDVNDDLRLDDPDRNAQFLRALITQEHGPASKRYDDNLIKNAVAASYDDEAGKSAGVRAIEDNFGVASEADPDIDAPERGGGGDPEGLGLARLAPKPEALPASDFLKTRLVGHTAEHIDNMNVDLQDRLAAMFSAAPPEIAEKLGIFSGARSVARQKVLWKAALKKYGSPEVARLWVAPPGHSMHNKGVAADLSYNGVSLAKAPKEVVAWVHENAGAYGLAFPLGNENWHVETIEARGGTLPKGFAVPARVAGAKSITVGADFQTTDPFGLYRGRESPFAVKPVEATAPAAEVQPAAATSAAPAGDLAAVPAGDGGRYQEMDEGQFAAWKADWEKTNRSSGIGGDFLRSLEQGTASLGLAARELVNQIPGVGPSIVAGLDRIDQWVTGTDPAKRMTEAGERAAASKTPEGQAAAGKEWVTETPNPDGTSVRYSLGPAWSDPRSYLGMVGESIPATVATMGGSGLLARGAFKFAVGKGMTTEVAAASAAKTALISGAIGEGLLGGGQSALSVREKIDALPREVLERSEGVQQLVKEGVSLDDAIAMVREDAATLAFITGGTVTGIFGGWGDKVLTRIVAEGVGGNVMQRVARGGARGAVGESVFEEVPQSAGQQLAENKAVQGVDPSQELMEGVPNAAAAGLVGGAAIGGGLGAAGGAVSPADAAAVADQAPPVAPGGAPVAPGTPPARPGGLADAVEHGQRTAPQQARPAAESRGTPPADAADRAKRAAANPNTPSVGSTVRVDEPDIPPFMARVESIEGDEAVVFDGATGEVYQVPLSSLSKLADEGGTIAKPNREIHLDSIEPADSAKPAASSKKPDQSAAREATSASAGAAAAEQTAKADEPAARADDAPRATGKARTVNGRTADFPDDAHASLYDLGEKLRISRGGNQSTARRDQVLADERQEVADSIGVPVDKINEIADDYRYRVERQARGGDGAFAANPVKPEKLAEWQRQRARTSDQADARPDVSAAAGGGASSAGEAISTEGDYAARHAALTAEADAHDTRNMSPLDMIVSAAAYGMSREQDVDDAGKAMAAGRPDVAQHMADRADRFAAEREAAVVKYGPDHKNAARIKENAATARDLATRLAAVVSGKPVKQLAAPVAEAPAQPNPKKAEESLPGAPSFVRNMTPEGKAAFQKTRPADRDIAILLGRKIDEIAAAGGTERATKLQAKLDEILDSIMPKVADDGTVTRPAAKKGAAPGGIDARTVREAINILDEGFSWDAAVAEARHRMAGGKPNKAPVPPKMDEAAARKVEQGLPKGWTIDRDPEGRKAVLRDPTGRPITMSEQIDLDDIKYHVGRAQEEQAKRDTDKAKQDDIDAAAHEAAPSPKNERPEPTEAQKEAGNYAKGHIRLGGLDISIENPEGSERKGTSGSGKPWSVTMKSHYGYIRGTVGKDKDHIDVFIKPGTTALDDGAPIFVVDQRNPAKHSFDEHKVMIGFPDLASAREGYAENYAKGWAGMHAITPTTLGEFKTWLAEGDTTAEFAKTRASAQPQKPAAASSVKEKALKLASLRKYAAGVVGDQVQSVSLIGSVAATGAGNDTDLLYDLGQQTLPENSDEAAERVTEIVESSPIDLDPYDSFFKVGDRYFHLSSGAGRDIIENTEYAKEQAGKPVVVLAEAPKPAATKAPKGGKQIGVNQDGHPIFEDDRGVRSFVANGVRITEKVAVNPAGGVSIDTTNRNANFLPVGAAAAESAPSRQNPSKSANTIFTDDAAEKARAILKAKLGGAQLTTGIDPEILQAGLTLAGWHIEKGARSFAQFAQAMLADLGEVARPYLKSWYMGVKYDPKASNLEGMSPAGEVDAADVAAYTIAATKEASDEPTKLDQPGPSPLEGIPADQVQSPVRGRNARKVPAGSSDPDLFGDRPARASGDASGRGVGSGERAVSDAAAGRQPAASDVVKPDASGNASRGERPADVPGEHVDASQSAATPAADRPVEYTLTDADGLGQGGAKAKYRQNVAAIRVLRTLEAENRTANRDEQAVLAKWVGWGGLAPAFGREDGTTAKGWEKEAAELKELLTGEEYRAAEQSTRNAHYTSPEVVRAIWKIAERLGFQGGQVLEPSIGSGNFIGLMPRNVRSATNVTGVELDRITGGIAKNLYPKANIQTPMGFEALSVPDDYFDLAIGNPPFGSERVYDAERPKLNKFSIHNFFFAKAIDAVRPGGVLAMVVTNYFMDSTDSKARAYIAERADLIGAIRLPNNAFAKNAGTDVTTDIIVLRKRAEGDEAKDNRWTRVHTYRDKEGREMPLNWHFVDQPQMMLGEFGAYGTMYRGDMTALVARPGDDLPALLDAAIAKLPRNIMPAPGAVLTEVVNVPETVADAAIGSMFLSPDGEVFVRDPDSLGRPQASVQAFPNDSAKTRVAGMIRVRDAFARLRKAQLDENASDAKIERLREKLNKFYDAFVRKNGPINQDVNKRLFRDDPTWPQISALETKFDKGVSAGVAKTTGQAARAPSAEKEAIFSKRTQFPYTTPTSARSAKDALYTVLNNLGRVDLAAMQALYGKSQAEIVDELGPLLYRAPDGTYETADAYLSGNVKQKLAEAERAVGADPELQRNVLALRDIIPADIEPVDINVKPGSPWVPANHVADFLDHITGTAGSAATYSPILAKWSLKPTHPTEASGIQWATNKASVGEVLAAAMNGARIIITHPPDREGKRAADVEGTDAANEKVEKVKAEWQRWLWQDDARREQLHRIYNDTYNTNVRRAFDGAHLTLPGKVGDDIIAFRPHQKNAVWRALQSGTTLLDHVVGAGKTFVKIAIIMEMRRIGRARKPMLTVPNHLVGQWAADFIRLYPGAKILAATKKDFEAENRKKLFARVATGDWDAIIVAHSSFGKIGVDPKFEAEFIEELIADHMAAEQSLRETDGKDSRTVKQVAKARQSLEAKLQRRMDAGAKDEGLTFDEMGVDAMLVDEAHEFKNLAYATSMTRIAGLSPAGSQKASDLFIKIRSVLSRTGGQNIVFATGTPISNTMAEMYTLQRYLSHQTLKDQGVGHFDAWARVFGEVVTDWELSPTGKYKLKSRFSKFVNIPELMQAYGSFADVISNDDIKAQMAARGQKMPLPKVKGGKPAIVVVPRSDSQAQFIGVARIDEHGHEHFAKGTLIYRSENLRGKPEKGADNMLKIMSDARKAALDMRLIDPSAPDVAGSKAHQAADSIKRLYDKWHTNRGTQLVFIDLSTPQKGRDKEMQKLRDLAAAADAGDEDAQEKLDAMSPDEFDALNSKFSVYDDLRQKLIDRGIPATEIAFIHDANTDPQKEELFGKVRAGRVRVLLGSTPKMGAGTNVQNRLTALHHLDAPWRPSDLEQRDGRGIRQGNELYAADPDGFELEINRYATENTLDAVLWQAIERKARFIAQVRNGNAKDREAEDVGGEAANAAEMKAAASGNPMILEEMELRRRVKKLEGQQTEHDREQHRVRQSLRNATIELAKIEKDAPAVAEDAKNARALDAAPLAATIDGTFVEKAGELGAAIIKAARRIDKQNDAGAPLGTLSGFPMELASAFQLEKGKGARFDIIIQGAQREMLVMLDDVEEASPVGTGMSVLNTIRKLQSGVERAAERKAAIEAQIPQLEKQIGPFAGADALNAEQERHREIIAILRPKPKPTAAPAEPTVAPEGASPSLAPEPVLLSTSDVPGPSLGVSRELVRRRARAALDGRTVQTADGDDVTITWQGIKHATAKADPNSLAAMLKMDELLAASRLTATEPDKFGRASVLAVHQYAAPALVDGVQSQVLIYVREHQDGKRFYDHAVLKNKALPGNLSYGAGSDPAHQPAEEPDDNIGDARLSGKAPAGWEPSEAAQADLLGIIRKTSGLDSVTFTRRITLPNGAHGWGVDAPTTASGFYDPVADAITLAADSAFPRTAYHEAFHRLQRLFLTSAERAVLAAEVGRLRRIVAGTLGRESQAPKMSGKELEAEAFAITAAGAATVKPHKALAAAWDRIATMLRRIRNYLAGHGFQTAEDVFARAKAGDIAAREAIDASTEGGKEFSLTENRVIEEVRGKFVDWTPAALATIPLNYFTELARPTMVAVGEYLRVKRVLDAYRGKKHAEADETAQAWLSFTRKGKAAAVELADLMHAATIAGVDPTSITKESREHPAYGALRARYMAMPVEAKRLFWRVRDDYKDQSAELDAIILDNIRKAQLIAQKHAEEEYRQSIERIQASRVSPQAKKDAIADAAATYKVVAKRSELSMKARLTKMRQLFESSRVPEPYFPLARFGEYTVTVRDVDGTILSFSKREKAAERDRLAADMRAAYPGATVTVGVMSATNELRGSMDPRIVAEIEEIIARAGLDPKTMGSVLDGIWQRYLETMPDLSIRKRFIHRQGTRGFERDALRAYGSHMFHAAHQMARLKYGAELQELANDALDQARKSDDPTRGTRLANELARRHDWVMNPEGSAVAQIMTSAAFVWFLGMTPAAAIVNTSQTPILGIPILGGRFGSIPRAAAAIAKAAVDSVAGRGTVTKANLSDDEKAAIEAFAESGLIDRTQSHDIAGVGETGVEYNPMRSRVMKVISWMFHRAEVWNREVTALAAYRMARADGQNVSDAIDTAHDLTWKVHFDYSNSSRPRILQSDVAKVALVFRAYNINMLYRVFRDAHQAFKGETPKARAEARRQLVGVMAMMSLMAGTTGVVGFNLAMAIAQAIFGDDDDPMDFATHYRKDVVDILGPELGGVVLDGVPGHYLGIDLTSRLGMPDLWFRSPPRDLQGRDEFEYYIMNSLGASVSMLGSLWQGGNQIVDGDVGKGIETVAPKWARDLMKAYRFSQEGVTNFYGDQIMPPDAMDSWDIIAQSLGFTPAKVAETYDRSAALKNAEGRILDKRRTLLNAFAMAVQMKDPDGRKDAIEAIKAFNAVPINKPLAITEDTLRQSLKARARNAAKREDGVLIANPALSKKLRQALPERLY